MVYKKYVRKNGKLIGPYYYESYREDGKVKKRYLGTTNPSIKNEHASRRLFALQVTLAIFISLIVFAFAYQSITGKSLVEQTGKVVDDILSGQTLNGLFSSESLDSSNQSSELATVEQPAPPASEVGFSDKNQSQEANLTVIEPIVIINESVSNETSNQTTNESVINQTDEQIFINQSSNQSQENQNESANRTATNVTVVNEIVSNPKIKKISTAHAKIRIGERVKWIKNVSLETAGNVTIELPKEAENVIVKKIEHGEEKKAIAEVGGITGNSILEARGFNIISWFRSLFAFITGKATAGNNADSPVDVILQDNATQYTIEYYTDAPQAFEKDTASGKEVIISGPDNLNYTDVLSFANIQEKYNVGQEDKIKIYWKENRSLVSFDAYDQDANGKLDYIEWITPHLSNQTFEIILITKAEHLDENRTFVEDVYDSVKARDNVYASIPAGDYVRVTFEKNLSSGNDITLYARSNSTNSGIKVYGKDGTQEIADFGAIGEDKEYKVILQNISSQDAFDLGVYGGNVEFDYIVDPDTTSPLINFVDPTPANGITQGSTNAIINISIVEENLTAFIFNWNGTNGSNLVGNGSGLTNTADILLNLHLDNNTAIGENETKAVDSSPFSTNATLINGATWDSNGKYNGALSFDGVDDYASFSDTNLPSGNSPVTISAWLKPTLVNGNYHTVWNYGTDIANQELEIYISSADRWCINDGAGESCGNTAIANQWVYVTVAHEGSTIKLYENGNLTGTYATSLNIILGGIGGVIGKYTSGNYFEGLIDEFKIYNRSLSDAEIKGLYNTNALNYSEDLVLKYNLNNDTTIGENETTAVDVSKYSTNATLYNGATWNTSGKYNGALQLDGVDDYAGFNDANMPTGANPRTISIWAKPSLVDNNYHMAWSYGTYAGIQDLSLYIDATQNKWAVSDSALGLTGNVAIANQWIFLTATYDGTTTKLYENGILTGSMSHVFGTVLSGTGMIGEHHTGIQNFPGQLDSFRVWNRSMSADEVNELYLKDNENTGGGSGGLTQINSTDWIFTANKIGLTDGTYTYYGYAKNGLGNTNSTETRTLTIDTTPPDITIVSPIEQTYLVNTTDFNVSLNEEGSWCGYSLNGAANITLTKYNQTYFNYTKKNLVDDAYTIIFSCNDTTNNLASASRSFAVDVIPPAISLNYPLSNYLITNPANVYFNYTPTDNIGISTCQLWGNWTGVWHLNQTNTSPVNAAVNSFIVNLTDGTYMWNVWCNDTLGIGDFSAQGNLTFTLQSGAPIVSFIPPTPATGSLQLNPDIFVNVSSAGPGDHYTFTDFNRDLKLWMRMDDVNASGDPTDLSSYSNNGTAFNGAVQNDSGKFGKSFSFDGVNDYASIPSSDSWNFGANDFAVSWWEYRNSCAGGATAIARNDIYPNPYSSYILGYCGAANADQIYMTSNQAGWDIASAKSLGTITLNRWDFYTVTRNGNTFFAYKDGAQTDSWTSSSAIYPVNAPFIIGEFYSSYFFDGKLDEVLIFNRSLSASEISSLYNATANKYFNNFTNLTSGIYNFTAYAVNLNGNKSQTETRTVTIDTTPPNGTILSPQNGTFTNNTSQNFTINVTDNFGLANVTLNIYNSTGLFNRTTVTLIGGPIQALVGIVVTLTDGVYNWFWEVVDLANNYFTTQSTEGNRTLTVDTIPPGIQFVAPTLANGTTTPNNFAVINISIIESNLIQFIFNWNGTNTTFLQNATSGSSIHPESLLVSLNLNNNSAIGENETLAVDEGLLSLNGSKYDDSYVGATWTPNGKFNGAMQFSGNAYGYIDFGDASALNGLNEFTISVWVNSTINGANQFIYAKGTTSDDVFITIQPSGVIDAGFNYAQETVSNIICPQNEWCHIIFNKNATGTNLWVDNGTYTDYVNTNQNSAVGSSSNEAYLGTRSSGIMKFAGTIDAFKIWNISMDNNTVGDGNFGGGAGSLTQINSNIWNFYSNQSNLTDGTYTYYGYAKDAVGNSNQTETRTIIVDATFPTIQFVSPTETNGSILTRNNILANVTANDTNLVNITIKLFNIAGLVQQNISGISPLFINFTNLVDGTYYLNATANDIAGNTNSTETRIVTVDRNAPLISITSPQNMSYNSVQTELNYTISDATPNTCWYSTNNGVTNATIVCGTNVTGLNSGQGSSTWRVYANDSFGRENSSPVTFFVDSIAPVLNIISPIEQTYLVNTTDFNVSLNEEGSWCGYSLNGAANITMTKYNQTYFNYTKKNLVDDAYTIVFSCNDTTNNFAFASRSFAVDVIPPAISLNYPLSNYFLNYSNNIYFNYTPTDNIGISTCQLWGNWTGAWHLNQTNTSPVNAVVNSFVLNLTDGVYGWNVWCNDTLGIGDFSAQGNLTFTIDSISPTIQFVDPTEASNSFLVRTSILINVTANDTNLANLTVRLFNSTGPMNISTITSSSFFLNFTSLADGTYYFNATAVDTTGNTNSTETRTVHIISKVAFVPPTPANGTVTENTSAEINISVHEPGLKDFIWNWNNTNYTFYNDSLVMMYNLDNNAGIGDGGSSVTDLSKYGTNGTSYGTSYVGGKYGNAINFGGSGVYIYASGSNVPVDSWTISFWTKRSSFSGVTYEQLFNRGTVGTQIYVPEASNMWNLYSGGTNLVGGSVVNGAWVYLTATYDGSTLRLYEDGNQTASGAAGSSTTGDFTIGNYLGSGAYQYLGLIDEIRVWNRPLSDDEIKEQYISNLEKYDPSQWYFYSNQSNLANGTYMYYGYAKNISGNQDSTETRTLTIGEVSDTISPSIDFVAPTDANGTSANRNNIVVNVTAFDVNLANITIFLYNLTGLVNSTTSITSPYFVNFTNLANGTYYFNATAVDTTGNTNSTETRTRFVTNSLPVVTLVFPANGSATTNRTPMLIWNATDADGDPLTYELNITAFPTGSDDNRYVQGLNATNYTISPMLKYLYDNGYSYRWSVRANDGFGFGAWSETRTFNVSAVVDISMINGTINFGDLSLLYSNDTTSDSPSPFILQNDGNSFVNVSVSATPIWTSVSSPNNFYKFKVNNASGHEGAFDWLNSITTFTAFDTLDVNAISSLNFSANKKRARVDIFVQVPSGEVAGAKNSNVSFISSLAE